MNFKIRFAKPEDVKSVMQLIHELAVYENEPDAVEIDENYVLKYGFGKHKAFDCLVAESEDDEILGMALFYNRFSTWKGLSIHLEDLIVKQKHRKKGIGKALFEALIKHAKTENINRLEWVVLDWNIDAIKFYESYGAKVFQEWRTVQMDKETIQNF
ncbi:GNAT family N-acetyltransferase [Flavobacterium sp. CS20]|jgi:GNAT superfamily N-acetyltransferase|uniref:GNAT family N-acetyltransferase n=1 Tax=Flavobacterium sp. CS20 TaxID=2775246 RepID=UPI001B3A1ACC|nr:GNAT family N-acetyltransferase [Flavobacterium sp. CS20]QTY26681.1 GNAT family N-acetyltransferase [Flavobacterium sp. CS20]